METLTAADAIRIWESSHRRLSAECAIVLLATAFPEQSRDELRQLTLGECNARLLDLRRSVFGNLLNAYAKCPGCGSRFEFSLNGQAFFHAHREVNESKFYLQSHQYEICFRSLNLGDLNAVTASDGIETARQQLIRRCVVEARRNDKAVSADDLPETVINDLAARLAESDPDAEFLIEVACPTCEFEFQLSFDVASFLSAEIAYEAQRLLREVHLLAKGYGWREGEILELSAPRRQFYLDMLDQ